MAIINKIKLNVITEIVRDCIFPGMMHLHGKIINQQGNK